MKEVTVEAEGGQGSAPNQHEKKGKGISSAAADVKNTAMKILGAREAYRDVYEEMQDKPSRFEVFGWYFYEFCTYFIQTVLIPVVFPLIISQLQHLSTDPLQQWLKNHPGSVCKDKEISLYSKLTERTVRASGTNYSSLEWTAIAWAGGLGIATPILGFISFHLDGQFQALITIAATALGVFFCLPAGFFRTSKIFIPYIAGIAAASAVASASHTHHLGLMLRGFTGQTIQKSQFHIRQGIASRLSLYSTACGCFGSALISSFTYHMLREPGDHEFISLWVVSIFSGLIWLAGLFHAFTAINRNSSSITFSSKFHPFSLFKYPHAIGAIVAVFFSSFTTMSIFTGGVLFIVGHLCIKPVHLLLFWLTYFLFPIISLPLLQPLSSMIKASAVKMQILGFLLSILCAGFGFYFHESHWKWRHLVVFGAIQSTSTGILYAFGRVLVLNCAPSGKEGAFSIWFSWMRAVGLCAGFAVGGSVAGRIRPSFGAAFCTAVAGIVVLLFGNISDVGGAVAAGHVKDDKERDPQGLDSKEAVHV